jgi:hypothetical protein
MEEKRFQRKIENFICLNCKEEIVGDGFTDHCSNCLWSKHVDVNPGDRKADCGGSMEPVGVKREGEGYTIFYKCLKCNHSYRVKSFKKDNFEELVKISKNPII